MRYLAIFFFGHLAATATAANCTTDHKVDLDVVPSSFKDGVNAPRIPSLEYSDHSAKKFRDLITKAVNVYGVDLLDIINHQAIEVGKKLVSDVQSANKKLQQSVRSGASHKSEPVRLNNDLKELTQQLETILKLNPGKSQVPNGIFPAIFEQPVELVPRTTKRTAEELFNDCDSIVNSLASNLFAYAIGLFRAGWAHARLDYNVFTSQLRDEVLNDKVLAASRKVVNEVDKQEDLVRRTVLPETWKSYRNAGDRILAAYDLYTASKVKDCH